MYSKSLIAISLLGFAAAKDIDVQVGATGLKFEPESITAVKGDVVHFKVYDEHNVAQSTFDSPCKPSGADAIYSGYMKETFDFAVTVNSSDSVWLYCGTGPHCQLGMVFAINPSSDQTIDMYATKAKNAGDGVNPANVHGGVINENSKSGAQTTSSQAAGASPTSSAKPTASSNAGTHSSTTSFVIGVSATVWFLGLLFE